MGRRCSEHVKLADYQYRKQTSYIGNKLLIYGNSPISDYLDKIMNIKWSISLKLIPELSDLPKEERKQLWKQCSMSGFSHWQTGFAFGISCMWAMLINALTMYLLEMFPSLNKYLMFFLKCIFGYGLGLYFFSMVLIAMVRPYIRAKRQF